MNLVYSPAKQAVELKLLAEIWFKDLGWMDTQFFQEAMARHLSRGQWFPIPAEIRGHYFAAKSEANAKGQAMLPMPEGVTDEQVRLNLKQIAAMREALATAQRMPARGNHD